MPPKAGSGWMCITFPPLRDWLSTRRSFSRRRGQGILVLCFCPHRRGRSYGDYQFSLEAYAFLSDHGNYRDECLT